MILQRRGMIGGGALGSGGGISWPSAYDSDLVRYFRMEEASGNLYDEISASSYTVAGATFTYEQTGIENNGINFGTDSECQIGAPLNGATSAAISIWADLTTASTTQYLYYSSGSSHAHVYHNATQIVVDMAGFNLFATKPANGWHHILVLYNGTEAEADIFIDGVLEDDTPSATPATSLATSAETIGSDNFSTNSTKCIVDEIAVWADVTFADAAEKLTFAEDLYNSGTGTFYP